MNKLLVYLNVVTLLFVLAVFAYVLVGGPKSNAPLGVAIPTIDSRHQELVDRLVAVELALQSVLATSAQNPAATQVLAEANAERNKTSIAGHQAPDDSAQYLAAQTLTDTIIQSGRMSGRQSMELRGALIQLKDRRQAQQLMKEIALAINNDQLKVDPGASL